MGLDNSTGEFDSYEYYKGDSGSATFTVISFTNNHIKGNFSEKQIQDDGNKMVIIQNGNLDTDLNE